MKKIRQVNPEAHARRQGCSTGRLALWRASERGRRYSNFALSIELRSVISYNRAEVWSGVCVWRSKRQANEQCIFFSSAGDCILD